MPARMIHAGAALALSLKAFALRQVVCVVLVAVDFIL
jgi:hypothetical protein